MASWGYQSDVRKSLQRLLSKNYGRRERSNNCDMKLSIRQPKRESCWIALRQQQLNPKHYASRPTRDDGAGRSREIKVVPTWTPTKALSYGRRVLWRIASKIDVNGRWHQLRKEREVVGRLASSTTDAKLPRWPLSKFASFLLTNNQKNNKQQNRKPNQRRLCWASLRNLVLCTWNFYKKKQKENQAVPKNHLQNLTPPLLVITTPLRQSCHCEDGNRLHNSGFVKNGLFI